MTDSHETDRQAWLSEATQRHESALLRYTARLAGHSETAREIVQDAFARLCEERPEAVDGHVGPWLYTVCRRRALDVRRKGRKMTMVSSLQLESRESKQPGPAACVESRQTGQRLLELVATLPDNQQEVVRLKFDGGLSYKEIAGVTGLSVTNVGFLLHTALKRLRVLMGESASDSPRGVS
jgi:RNA polymerase sigma-70 factor (ECF subfamily)